MSLKKVSYIENLLSYEELFVKTTHLKVYYRESSLY